jgi:hypothetical protein
MSSATMSLEISSSDGSTSCRRLLLNKCGCLRIKLCLMYVSFETVPIANLKEFQNYKGRKHYQLRTFVWMASLIDSFLSVAALVIGMICRILKIVARIVCWGAFRLQQTNGSGDLLQPMLICCNLLRIQRCIQACHHHSL